MLFLSLLTTNYNEPTHQKITYTYLYKTIEEINFMLKLVFYFAAISSLLLFSGCGNGNDNAQNYLRLPAMMVDTTTALTVKDYIGTIEGKINVEIRSQVEGILEEIYVDEGQYVYAGQPLFKINPLPYQEILNNAIATENVERAKLKNAKLEVERILPLVENEVIAEVQLKAVKANYEVAQASLARASAAVASARINYNFTTITAPVQGYIGMIPKRVGNLINRGEKTPLTVLSDVSDVYVYFSISESDFLYFTKNKTKINDTTRNALGSILPEATLFLADGLEYPQKGKVDAVSGQVNRNTGSISLRASFPNSAEIMRSGNTGTIQLKEAKKGVILIPQEAIITIQDRHFVYIIDKESKARMTPVTLDGVADKQYIVSDGLKRGDIVILTGFHKLEEGALVKPKKD